MIALLTPPLRLLAQGLGLTLDEVREHRDVAIADRHYSFDAGEIPPGTIASVRMRFNGIVDGQPRLHFSAIWSMPDEAVEDRQPSTSRSMAGSYPGSAATAVRVVNAIPAVCPPTGVFSARLTSSSLPKQR